VKKNEVTTPGLMSIRNTRESKASNVIGEIRHPKIKENVRVARVC